MQDGNGSENVIQKPTLRSFTLHDNNLSRIIKKNEKWVNPPGGEIF